MTTGLNADVDKTTSKRMAAVRQTGTSAEIAVRDVLESSGIEFATNVKGKPGRPDIWLLSSDTPIFVHGCFWHRHEGCSKATTPKTNAEFWLSKFESNKLRDAKVQLELESLGYPPVTIWQCETTVRTVLDKVLEERIGGRAT